MQLHECKVGLAVDHESGKQGIICKEPWFRDYDQEWFIPVMRLNGEEEQMFPRRLTKHDKLVKATYENIERIGYVEI